MRRVPVLTKALTFAVALSVAAMFTAGGASAAPGDPIPDPNIKPAPGDPATVSQFPQATWQTNGIVWAMEQVGGVVYVGGNFTKVRPPGAKVGQQEQARKNLAAFDSKTGALLPFSHDFTSPTFTYDPATQRPDVSCTVNWDAHTYTCDTVYEIKKSPNGDKIYVGGDFVKVDGKDRRKLAAFSTTNAKTANNALDTGFKPMSTDRRVRALAVSNTTVYAGGMFTSTVGQARTKAAAFNRNTGALLPWAPKIAGTGANPCCSSTVMAMVMSPDQSRVILAGGFDTVNGTSIHGLAAVDANSGANTRWDYRLPRREQAITDLVADNDTVYAAIDDYGTTDGRLALNPLTGQTRWVDGCRGATWALAIIGEVLYGGSHNHNCSTTEGGFPEIGTGPNAKWQRLTAQTTKGTSTRLIPWWPNTNGGDYSLPADRTPSRLGPRAMTADGENLWVGGSFTVVNGKPQQSLARFAPTAGAAPAARVDESVPGPETNPDPPADGNAAEPAPTDNGTFPGGPAPDGKPQPGVDNQPAPAKPVVTPKPKPVTPVVNQPATSTPAAEQKPEPVVEQPKPVERPKAEPKVTTTPDTTPKPTKSAEPTKTPSPSPSKNTPTATPSKTADQASLPVTGSSLPLFIALAAGLVIAGAVFVIAARRRAHG